MARRTTVCVVNYVTQSHGNVKMSMRHRILFEIKALKESVFGKGDADRNMSEYNLHHSLRHTDLLHETATELLRTYGGSVGNHYVVCSRR